MTDKRYSMDEALDLIKSGDVMASSGFGMAGMAEEVLTRLEERFLKTGQPRGLTQYSGSGLSDSAGGGSDHLAHEGLLKRIVSAFFGTNLKIGEMISNNEVEAYNVPQGTVMRLYRARLCGENRYLTKVGLNTYVDPRLEGGRMTARSTDDIVEVVTIKGEEYLSYDVPKFDIGLVRATAADADGNLCIDEEVVKTDIRLIAMAVKACGGKVIAQVKRIVPRGSLAADKVYVPGIFVDAVVLCGEPEKNHRPIGDMTGYDPTLTGHSRALKTKNGKLPMSAKKVIARRCAQELKSGAIVNLGIGAPEFIAAVADEEGVYERMTLTAESGVIGGIPCGGKDFGAARNAVAMIEQESQFDFYDGGGLDITYLGFAQADQAGSANISRFGSRIYGCGGSINISQNTKRLIFCGTFTAGGLRESFCGGKLVIEQEGKNKKFLQKIDQITYHGKMGFENGQEVLYITERAVFRVTRGGLELIEIAPGVDLDRDVLAQMEFCPKISDHLSTMDSVLFGEGLVGLQRQMV